MKKNTSSVEAKPLAELLRPKTLDDVIGQEHIVGKSGMLRKMLVSGFIPSMIFWGPPGCGKTTLAELVSTLTKSVFVSKSAVTTNLADIRNVIAQAAERLETSKTRTVLFIDEIHRFNKAQQDALLPHVEKGTVIFIGATTENPSFEVISPLLSRSRVLVLHALTDNELQQIAKRGLKFVKRTITNEGMSALLTFSNGDARQILTMIEIAAKLNTHPQLTVVDIEEAAQRKMLQYDKLGDNHYDTISAFIKSLRASDVDAALYYLARMVCAGEDPLFIARRMVVFASEDIGMAQPTALVVANAVFRACETIGFPECQENLAHGVVYLCKAAKNRDAYDAYMAAMKDVETFGNLPIPLPIRNAPTSLMKGLGYGKGYEKYSKESYLPDKLKGKQYYPKNQ